MVLYSGYFNWFFERVGEMNEEEILLDNTEFETEVETLVEVDSSAVYLEQIAGDVRVLVVFAIVTFFTACLRGWRNTVVKGVR